MPSQTELSGIQGNQGNVQGTTAADGGNETKLRLSLRMKCYTCIVDMFAGLIFTNENSTAQVNPSHIQQQLAQTAQLHTKNQGIIEHLLNRCQDFQDKMFHYVLYSYLYDCKQYHLYENIIDKSKHVEEFLLSKGKENSNYYTSLINYYVNQNNLMSAANVCAVLAKQEAIDANDNIPDITKRIELLSRSIYYVRGKSF
tara:strand:+ start:73 stop:669 length:597 start_codon:yes stop_codon:yes gene_type:complete